MIRRTSLRIGLWGIALLALIGAIPASALAGTLANGNYTAAPGEQNLLSIDYDPGTASYTYLDFAGITDGDGPGGCTVTLQQATCPAAVVSHISIALLDGNDGAQLTPFVSGSPLPTLGPSGQRAGHDRGR